MTAKSFLVLLTAVFSIAFASDAMAVKSVQPTIQILLDDDELLKSGRAAIHAGNLDKAAFYYEEALKRENNLSRVELIVVHSDLCVAYMYLERFGEAIEQCKKSLFMQPNRWQTLNNLGTVYLVQGDYESALEVYRRGLRMKPDSRILLFNHDLAKKRSELSGAQNIELLDPQINSGEDESGGYYRDTDTR